MIRLDSVSKCFNQGKPNQFKALKEVTLDIPMGQITVVRGPSGSGKTTLLAIIGCMSRPTSGRVWVGGREISSLTERFASELRRKIFGFVFQQYHLIKGISVIENVILPSFPLGTARSLVEKRAQALLNELGVGSKAGERVQDLSGGEQQRVAVARAMINDPDIVIADEPTAHLDTGQSVELLSIFEGLRERGKTILLASHDPLVIEFKGVQRVISMRDGRLEEGESQYGP